MMSDRKLLELAAKAAGIECTAAVHALNEAAKISGIRQSWNPLTDDGHALRLAVKLGLLVNVCNEEPPHNQSYAVSEGRQAMVEPHSRDPYAATRRAIVRAAAEIGAAK